MRRWRPRLRAHSPPVVADPWFAVWWAGISCSLGSAPGVCQHAGMHHVDRGAGCLGIDLVEDVAELYIRPGPSG